MPASGSRGRSAGSAACPARPSSRSRSRRLVSGSLLGSLGGAAGSASWLIALPGRGATRLQPSQRASDSCSRRIGLADLARWCAVTASCTKPSSCTVRSSVASCVKAYVPYARAQRAPVALALVPHVDDVAADELLGRERRSATDEPMLGLVGVGAAAVSESVAGAVPCVHDRQPAAAQRGQRRGQRGVRRGQPRALAEDLAQPVELEQRAVDVDVNERHSPRSRAAAGRPSVRFRWGTATKRSVSSSASTRGHRSEARKCGRTQTQRRRETAAAPRRAERRR